MKTVKFMLRLGLPVSFAIVVIFSANVSAQMLRVDSVSVDSVWNTDSSSGATLIRQSRDCRISFIPQGTGTAMMTLTVSVDGGKTFSTFSDSLTVAGYTLFSPLQTGSKTSVTVRVLGGDRSAVSFRMTAQQQAPVIVGNPPTIVLGPTGAPAAGSVVQPKFTIMLANDSSNFGYSTIAKVVWDTTGTGKYDTTKGPSAFSLTWSTKVPAGSSGQTKHVFVYAIDGNGLASAPETLGVQFGLSRPIVMKSIAAGTFMMGDTGIEGDIAKPVHQVSLNAFSFQETPVTQEQYLAVTGKTPSFSVGDLKRPVEQVSWYDAILCCNTLSKLSSLDTCYSYTKADASDAVCNIAKKGYRLPTEAEWEYTCRAGGAAPTSTYWWGPDSNGLGAHVYIPSWSSSTSTDEVAQKPANALGIYDIEGNGWKWCNDAYSLTYYASSPTSNPTGPASGLARALRGGADVGSYFVLEDYYKSGDRSGQLPDQGSKYVGFFCAQTK